MPPPEATYSLEVETITQAANRLHEVFDSVVMLVSCVHEGRSRWFAAERGNRFANSDLVARFSRGEIPSFGEESAPLPK